jgi:hypothetical protein
MTERYFGKVVSISDEYTVVLNRGTDQGVGIGHKFLIVGLGDIITDPDTGEELERLELVRGRVVVDHVQPKIATLKSSQYEKSEDVKEIKTVSTKASLALAIFGPEETVTETVTPGDRHLKDIAGVVIGDRAIKL